MTSTTQPESAAKKTAPAGPVQVSIIIPAYNEEKRIADTLDRLDQYFRMQPYTCEVIVVDDGSRDGTARLVRDTFPNVHLLSYQPNRGKGYAVKQGMLAATGRYRFYYDADGSTPITELDKVWPQFEKGFDIVVGSRSLPKSQVQVRQNLLRQSMGRLYNKFVRLILRERMIDTQCGFKGFTAESVNRIFPRQTMNRFAFDAELLYIARKHGLRVIDIPVVWRNSPDSRVTILGDSSRMLCDLIRIKLRDWFGAYR